MKKLFFLATLLLFVSTRMEAQLLKIGDKFPDVNVGKLINYPQQQLKFSAVKSKLIILDYWSTFCSPCIAGLPKMDSLQKKFKEEIFILPVTLEKEDRIRAFWIKSKYTKDTSLPTIVDDTLYKHLPINGVPFEVWILDGKIFAFTEPDKVNEQEIKDVLSGKPKSWATPPSSSALKEPDVKLHLLKLINEDAAGVFYSAISINDPSLKNRPLIFDNFSDQKRAFTRLLLLARPIVSLYEQSFRLMDGNKSSWMQQRNRVILEVKDATRYYCPDATYEKEWNRDNYYSYEAVLPAKVSKYGMADYMKADLDKFFGLTTRVEKRDVECWVLSLKRGINRISNRLSPTYMAVERRLKEFDLIKDPQIRLDAKNELQNDQRYIDEYNERLFVDVGSIIWYMNNVYNRASNVCPIIDETAYKDRFNITIRLPNPNKGLPSFDEFKTELNKHGFELKKEVRKLDMLVIIEKN